MKFTLSWLKEYLETDATVQTIRDTLNNIGLEVENIDDKTEALKDFHVAHIIEANQHPNADRLRVCKVNTGTEIIQIVCGAPNARAGLKAVLGRPGVTIPSSGIVLKLSEIRGVASHGMLCSSEELGLNEASDGILELPETVIIGKPFAPQIGLDNPVFDIAITPNRSDCFGIYGIARDLVAAGIGTLKPHKPYKINGLYSPSITLNFGIQDTQWCPLFAGRMITGVKNTPSPQWLQDALRSIGLRPISALVDITNYMTIAFNRPLHVFDADKITGNVLTIRAASNGETFAALDGKTYLLTPNMCVIADEAGVQSLAGIMGGAVTGCDESTVNVFLESALWSPYNIAKTARALGIHSDARQRFERGVDPKYTLDGLDHATQLILDICGGKASDVTKIGAFPDDDRIIKFPLTEVKRLTGVEVPAFEMKLTLQSLGFFIGKSSVDEWQIIPPSWRPDIAGKADIVEEIIRILGLNRIDAIPFPRYNHIHKPILTHAQSRIRKSRRALAARGLNEAVNWSFISEKDTKIFGGNTDELTLENPISRELSVMRGSLLTGLLGTVSRNQARGYHNLNFCEIGTIWHGKNPDQQQNSAAAVRVGLIVGEKHWENKAIADVYTVKQDMFSALDAIGFSGSSAQISSDNIPSYFHPTRSGILKLGKISLGIFGEIHPSILQKFDITGRVVAFELNLDAIPSPKQKSTKAKPKLTLNPLQSLSRDFAFIVESSTKAGEIVRVIQKSEQKHITNVQIFDVYEGKNTDGKKSIAVEVTLQPFEKSFTDTQIDMICEKIIHSAGSVGAVLRK